MDTFAPDDANFASLLWRAGLHHGPHTAMVEHGEICTFSDLRDRAAAIAAALVARGIAPGDRVGVLLRRGPDAAAAFFGALAAGAIGINVNENYAPRQIEHVLQSAGVRTLLTSPAILGQYPRPLVTDATFIDLATLPRGESFSPLPRRPRDPAQITFTSGSTGHPKGVVFSHANLWAGVNTVVGYLGISASDRIGSLLPFSFVYGFSQLTCAIATGATLVIERATLAQDLARGLRKQRVTALAGVPPLWLQLLRVGDFTASPLPDLRIITNAGGRLAPEAVLRLRQVQPQARLFLMYGLTEVFRSTYLPPEEVDQHPDSMGRAIPGAEVYVLREDGTLCPPGEVGELVHRGPTVGLGYWADPDGTAKVYRPNPFRGPGDDPEERVVFSGDLVRRDETGRLYYVSRKDRLIKTLGYRVSPDEIADVLFGSGQVAEAVVAGEPDSERGERIVAFVVLKPGVTLEDIRRFVGAELPRYMWPARYEVRDSLPRNAAGKYDLHALLSKPTT